MNRDCCLFLSRVVSAACRPFIAPRSFKSAAAFRGSRLLRYLLFAVVLTPLWLLVRSVAPPAGLTRSFYYPLEREYPRARATDALVEERTTAIDLTFIDEQRRPNRFYRVRWHGVWFSPRPERVDFYAGADDAVGMRVDGEIVLERNPTVGMRTEGRTVELDAGAHRFEIDHWQRGGGRYLNVQWALAGGTPKTLNPNRLFEQAPGAFAYWLVVTSSQLQILVLLVWAAGPTVLLGRMVYRTASVMTARDLRTRLRTVLFPALLGPCQVLLFGPLTVHTTNRVEFLAPFWSFALRGSGCSLRSWARWSRSGSFYQRGGSRATWPYSLLSVCCSGYKGTSCSPIMACWTAESSTLRPTRGGRRSSSVCGSERSPSRRSSLRRSPRQRRWGAKSWWWCRGSSCCCKRAHPHCRRPLDTRRLLPGDWPPPEIYQLSRTRNLIHIVLDMFPTEHFVAIVDADRSTFDRDLPGFTVFADHLGAFPTTKASMPAMLSGVAYRNEMPLDVFLERRAQPTVFQALGQHGFHRRALSSYSFDLTREGRAVADTAIQYNIPSPYSTSRDYLDVTAAQLLDVSLFRHVPHGVKAGIYRDQQWLFQPWLAARRAVVAERSFSDAAFLLEFARRVTLGGDDPVYTFMHLMTPHPPVATNADCTYPGRRQAITVERYTAQARCALSGVRELLDRLRELDIYDSSAILLTSDHGLAVFRSSRGNERLRRQQELPDLSAPADDYPFRGMSSPAGALDRIVPKATPFLAIKPARSQGPLRLSYAPTAITDLPATLLDLVGLPNTIGRGVSVFAIEPTAPRERTYAHYEWGVRNTWTTGPYFDVLHVFSVNGRVTTLIHGTTSRPSSNRPTSDDDSQGSHVNQLAVARFPVSKLVPATCRMACGTHARQEENCLPRCKA